MTDKTMEDLNCDIRQGTGRRAQPVMVPAAKPDVHTLEQAGASPPHAHIGTLADSVTHVKGKVGGGWAEKGEVGCSG